VDGKGYTNARLAKDGAEADHVVCHSARFLCRREPSGRGRPLGQTP
jgi:hypothetical protein